MQDGNIFSVTEINEYIKLTLESNSVLRSVLLKGEISNLKSNYSSGHMYFSLKDANSAIRAVMFRSSASKLKFMPESGMRVIVHGRISAYTVSGDCQIIIDDMQPDGAGALAVAFEQLKRRLEAQGLFDASRKKPIPQLARSVGVITSASGAALHDIINVSGRRNPAIEIVIYPSYVQGELAPQSLAGGIRFFNNKHRVDVIIIGRGGGSQEDLWCFNDEMLARTISESEIPVISAVGHETDYTICDFVSDMRAPTPSAAAELAFFDAGELRHRVYQMKQRNDASISRRISELSRGIELLRKDIELYSPINVLNDKQARLDSIAQRMDSLMRDRMNCKQNDLRVLCTKLEGVNPLAVLSRGYSAVQDQKGNIVSGIGDVEIGESITVRLVDGELSARVTQKTQKHTEVN